MVRYSESWTTLSALLVPLCFFSLVCHVFFILDIHSEFDCLGHWLLILPWKYLNLLKLYCLYWSRNKVYVYFIYMYFLPIPISALFILIFSLYFCYILYHYSGFWTRQRTIYYICTFLPYKENGWFPYIAGTRFARAFGPNWILIILL